MIVKGEQNADGLNEFVMYGRIVKADVKRRRAYVTFYEPNKPDAEGDWAKAEVIEEMCHSYLRFCLQLMIDINHDGRVGRGVLVESFILRGTDPMFPDTLPGSWVGVIEFGEEVELRINEGELTGVSIEGLAKLDFTSQPPNFTSKSAQDKPVVKATITSQIKVLR